MTKSEADLTRWLDIIRGEFREMPGLALTPHEFELLWGLDRRTTHEAIQRLVQTHFLMPTRGGRYARPGHKT